MIGKKLRGGIAGFGVVGKKRKLCADLNPHLEVVAVCDRYFFTSGVAPGSVKAFTNYEDLLGEDLDVLFVCMTNENNSFCLTTKNITKVFVHFFKFK